MTYPSLPIVQDESEAVANAGIEATRATNGALKRRRLYSETKTDFTVVHALSRTELDALMAHYEANKDGEFPFRWPGDGVTYTCGYTEQPQVSRRTNHYRATVRLAQV